MCLSLGTITGEHWRLFVTVYSHLTTPATRLDETGDDGTTSSETRRQSLLSASSLGGVGWSWGSSNRDSLNISTHEGLTRRILSGQLSYTDATDYQTQTWDRVGVGADSYTVQQIEETKE